MFRNPFDGARAKIERSHRHFRELIAAQDAFKAEQPLAIELVPQPNGDTKAFAAIKALPTLDQCAIVADIVNNFRACLDISVSQACLARGQKDEKLLNKTYFAFAGSAKDWDSNVCNRMAGADSVIRDAVRSFRPWKEDGNTLLYALSKIVANDKHVDLVPIGAATHGMEINGLKFARGDGKLVRFQGVVPHWGGRDPVEIFTIGSPAKVEITGPCVLKTSFGFGEVFGLKGKPVVPTLNEMGVMCEKIIDTIEAAANS